MALLLGSVKKKDRKLLEESAKILVATPQTIANDLKSGNFTLDGFGAAVFDECHHAVGKYAYTYIADELANLDIYMLGLTASPGSKPERVMSLVKILRIKHIEARISTDLDVIDYVMPKYVHFVDIELSERIRQIAQLIRPIGEDSLKTLRNMGLLTFKSFDTIPKGRLIETGNMIGKISATGYRYGALYSYSRLLNTIHAYDLLTTEGLHPFIAYINSLKEREAKSKSVESFLGNKGMVSAVEMAESSIRGGEEHPKVSTLSQILSGYGDKSAIVFAQYRSTVKMLVDMLQKEGFKAKAFVGKKEGVTQEQQKAAIEDFRSASSTSW